MKKIRLNLKKISIILSSTLLMAVSSCKFAPDLRTQLKLITEQAEVIKTKIIAGDPEKINNTWLVPSNKDFTIEYEIRNPQQYKFENNLQTQEMLDIYHDATNIIIEQSTKDKNKITITYKTQYLQTVEKSSRAITPYIKLINNETGKLVEYTDKEYAATDRTIFCDSAPKKIDKMQVFFTKLDSTNPADKEKNLFIFDMPYTASEFAKADCQDNDVKKVHIYSRAEGSSVESSHYIYNLIFDPETDTEDSYHYKFEPAETANKYNNVELITADEFIKKGRNPDAEISSYNYGDISNSSQTVLFFTDDVYGESDGRIEYVVYLEDKKTLKSEEISDFTNETPKLPTGILLQDLSDTITILDGKSAELWQTPETYFANIKLTPPDTIYWYEITNENGNNEVKTKYTDPKTDKTFSIEFKSNGTSYLDFSHYNGSASEKAEINDRFEEWKNDTSKVNLVSDPLPSNATIRYEIDDSALAIYINEKNTGNWKDIIIPPGTFTVTAHVECSDAVGSKYPNYRNSNDETFTVTVLANKFFVEDHNHIPNALDYGSDDKPFFSISEAAEKLTKPNNEANNITVRGNLTENIELPFRGNSETNILKLDSLRSRDNTNSYPTVTAADKNKPVLNIGNNFNVTVDNFTFKGDIVIGDNVTVTFTDCTIIGNVTVGDNSKLTITTTNNSTVTGDITTGENTTLVITKEAIIGNIQTGDNPVVAKTETKPEALNITASTITGNIEIGKYSTAKLDRTIVTCSEEELNNLEAIKNLGEEPIKYADYAALTGGHIYVGTASVLELSDSADAQKFTESNTSVKGIVTLARPVEDQTGAPVDWSLIKTTNRYQLEEDDTLRIAMDNPPKLDVPVLDFSGLSNETRRQQARDDISSGNGKHFVFAMLGYYIDVKDPENSVTAIIQAAGVGILTPADKGFTIELTNISNNTATSGATIKMSVSRKTGMDKDKVKNKTLTLYLLGDEVITSNTGSLTLTKDGKGDGAKLPAGNYTLRASFEYEGTVFSDLLQLTIK